MTHFSRPMTGLIALAIAAIIIGNFVSPATPFLHPSWGYMIGTGCDCHNTGDGIWLNGTEWDSEDNVFLVDADGGKSFSFLIEIQRPPQQIVGILPSVIAWMPDMTDNVQFKFDPQKVEDDSPQDQDSRPGVVTALFKVVVPDKPGTYVISLAADGNILSTLVRVKSASGSVLSGSASIVSVDSPSVAKTGGSVGMKVTLRNTGSESHRLYVYVTDRATGEQVFSKVYSEEAVPKNGTILLSGEFEMPNSTLGLLIHAGHVQDGSDADDALFAVSVTLAFPSPPTQEIPFDVLAKQWVPWITIAVAFLGSVQFAKSYDDRRRRLLIGRTGKLNVAVVKCALCGVCESTIANFREDVLNILSHKVDLALSVTSAKAYEPVDVALVVGSIRTEEDVRAVKEAREKARYLVAFGACPVFGVLPTGDRRLVESITRKSRKPVALEEIPEVKDEIRPLSDYVTVDLTIPGCAPPPETIRTALETILYDLASKERK